MMELYSYMYITGIALFLRIAFAQTTQPPTPGPTNFNIGRTERSYAPIQTFCPSQSGCCPEANNANSFFSGQCKDNEGYAGAIIDVDWIDDVVRIYVKMRSDYYVGFAFVDSFSANVAGTRMVFVGKPIQNEVETRMLNENDAGSVTTNYWNVTKDEDATYYVSNCCGQSQKNLEFWILERQRVAPNGCTDCHTFDDKNDLNLILATGNSYLPSYVQWHWDNDQRYPNLDCGTNCVQETLYSPYNPTTAPTQSPIDRDCIAAKLELLNVDELAAWYKDINDHPNNADVAYWGFNNFTDKAKHAFNGLYKRNQGTPQWYAYKSKPGFIASGPNYGQYAYMGPNYPGSKEIRLNYSQWDTDYDWDKQNLVKSHLPYSDESGIFNWTYPESNTGWRNSSIQPINLRFNITCMPPTMEPTKAPTPAPTAFPHWTPQCDTADDDCVYLQWTGSLWGSCQEYDGRHCKGDYKSKCLVNGALNGNNEMIIADNVCRSMQRNDGFYAMQCVLNPDGTRRLVGDWKCNDCTCSNCANSNGLRQQSLNLTEEQCGILSNDAAPVFSEAAGFGYARWGNGYFENRTANIGIINCVAAKEPAKIDPTSTCYVAPTTEPTKAPSGAPTIPTLVPTMNPSATPTKDPSEMPTKTPTNVPTKIPTNIPTNVPTKTTLAPTQAPTSQTGSPTTYFPTSSPNTRAPTLNPSFQPSKMPSLIPTMTPCHNPTIIPTNAPFGSQDIFCGDVKSSQGPFSSLPSYSSPRSFFINFPYDGGDIEFSLTGYSWNPSNIAVFDESDNEIVSYWSHTFTAADWKQEKYKIVIRGATGDSDDSDLRYDLMVKCTSPDPTPSPTEHPTRDPTERPTNHPSRLPTPTPTEAPTKQLCDFQTDRNCAVADVWGSCENVGPPGTSQSYMATFLFDGHCRQAPSGFYYFAICDEQSKRFRMVTDCDDCTCSKCQDVWSSRFALGECVKREHYNITWSAGDINNFQCVPNANTFVPIPTGLCAPSEAPTGSTLMPSMVPTESPLDTTLDPSRYPTMTPSFYPTRGPTVFPSDSPSMEPTDDPLTATCGKFDDVYFELDEICKFCFAESSNSTAVCKEVNETEMDVDEQNCFLDLCSLECEFDSVQIKPERSNNGGFGKKQCGCGRFKCAEGITSAPTSSEPTIAPSDDSEDFNKGNAVRCEFKMFAWLIGTLIFVI